MQLQMTTDYALRMLMYIAAEKRIVPSTELAEQLVIPQKYVLRVGDMLKRNKFVDTVSGSKGGYIMRKPLEKVSVYDVLVAIEGTIKINRCLEEDGYCSREATASCVVHHFMREVQKDFEEKMKSETLATLLVKAKSL